MQTALAALTMDVLIGRCASERQDQRPRQIANAFCLAGDHAMMIRTRQAKVQFLHPFLLSGLDGPQPAGTYRLITDEEQLCGLSFITYRTVLALLQLPALGRPGVRSRLVPISLDDLDACICADRQIPASTMPRLAAAVA